MIAAVLSTVQGSSVLWMSDDNKRTRRRKASREVEPLPWDAGHAHLPQDGNSFTGRILK